MTTSNNIDLYAEYMQEREGATVLATPDGFLSYRIEGKECVITSVFVREKSRTSGLASKLFTMVFEIARERNCSHLSGSVYLGTKNANHLLKIYIGLGISVVKAEHGAITFLKEL